MQITIPFSFTTTEVPAKCRKAREVRKDSTATVKIEEVSSGNAPVAFIEHGDNYSEKFTREYRFYDECLWLISNESQTIAQFLADPSVLKPTSSSYRSEQENRDSIKREAAEILFIDGVRWDLTKEPEYVIKASVNWASLEVEFGAVHGPGDPWHFRIDQLEEALEEIRGTHGEEVEHYSQFDILIPEALGLPKTPKQEKFSVTLTLEVEARGAYAAAREFASSLGIRRYSLNEYAFAVASLQSGDKTNVKLLNERS
jgi:hypothetical protein